MPASLKIYKPDVRLEVYAGPERDYIYIATRAPWWTVDDHFLIPSGDRRTSYEIATDLTPSGIRWAVNQCGYLWACLHKPELRLALAELDLSRGIYLIPDVA